jgi:hypothetical protein
LPILRNEADVGPAERGVVGDDAAAVARGPSLGGLPSAGEASNVLEALLGERVEDVDADHRRLPGSARPFCLR